MADIVQAGDRIEMARRALANALRAGAIESPELDSRLLVGHVLALDLTGLARMALRPLTPAEATTLNALAQRRLAGEPVARILGSREFWGLSFALNSATLVPRPDTETLVECALAILRGEKISTPRIADLGTGSGAILLALLHELPDANGIGTDISSEALDAARANAEKLGLAARAQFVRCDYASALQGPFDLIMSNPPYIRRADIAGLATEVRAHDPLLALDGGDDGLDAYRALAADIPRILRSGGSLLVEIGHDQEDAVSGIFQHAGFDVPEAARRDLAGQPRVVRAIQKG